MTIDCGWGKNFTAHQFSTSFPALTIAGEP
jgi:hypothetical protein